MAVVVVEDHPASAVADPAPLGLAAFALTTFLLSGHNAGFIPDVIWLGAALAYGGLVQLLAGMWEFRNRNVFGATAFSSYGGFWLTLGAFVLIITTTKLGTGLDVLSSEAWFTIAFAIFNSYMLLWSARLNWAIFGVFLTLEVTEILLAIGFLLDAHGHGDGWIKVGGWAGLVTAAVAWYASAAGVANGMADGPVLPVGKPLARFRSAARGA
jgi:succinate-acetate transporter protein